MTINNVTIGDQFTRRKDKVKRTYTVVDFHEIKSLTTGEVVEHLCICEHTFMGQVLKTEEPFASVVIGKINKP